ncbi:hypothetical protein D9M71_172660 [compost metagenome]
MPATQALGGGISKPDSQPENCGGTCAGCASRGLASELIDGSKVRSGTGSQRMQRTSMDDSAHWLARSAEESIILVGKSISPSFRLFV